MNIEEVKGLNVEKVVDARGTACPGPLLEAKRGIVGVPQKGIMELLSSDEGTNSDVPLWCKKVGHEYLGNIEVDGHWRLFIRRMK